MGFVSVSRSPVCGVGRDTVTGDQLKQCIDHLSDLFYFFFK